LAGREKEAKIASFVPKSLVDGNWHQPEEQGQAETSSKALSALRACPGFSSLSIGCGFTHRNQNTSSFQIGVLCASLEKNALRPTVCLVPKLQTGSELNQQD
jgi:hypothetical protein